MPSAEWTANCRRSEILRTIALHKVLKNLQFSTPVRAYFRSFPLLWKEQAGVPALSELSLDRKNG